MSIIDRLYTYDGTELNLQSDEEIQQTRESDLVYTERRGTYIPQCACYDSTRNCFYLIGNNINTDGTARIYAFNDWRHPDVEIRSAVVSTGHSNSIAYNPTTDEILVACGGGSASGEAQYANDIAVVDAATLTIKRRVTYSSGDKPDGIAFCGDCICVHVLGSVSRLELRSLDLSSVIKSKNAPKSVVSNYLGYAAEGCMVGQSLTYDPDTGMIYRVYSGYSTGFSPNGTEHIGEYNYGILAGYSKSDLSFKYTITVQAYDREEIESYIFGEDFDYIVATGAYNLYRIYPKKFPTTIARTAIPSGADINTYFNIGEYFSMSAAVTQTLLHIPTLDSGFTLLIYPTGNDLRIQVIFDIHGNIYTRCGKTTSDWTAWQKVSLTTAS